MVAWGRLIRETPDADTVDPRTIVAAIGFGARDAQAEGKYWPWCARYDGWTIVCGFATFQQCLATVSGVGGICQQNVMPPPVAEGVRYKRKRHARRHR